MGTSCMDEGAGEGSLCTWQTCTSMNYDDDDEHDSSVMMIGKGIYME